jgi:hypothetical protein
MDSTSSRFVVGMLLALVIAEGTAILVLNHGTLTFTIDDPYIHLALAENIARGHYGINLSEVSSPASSALWPLLLVPFASSPAAAHVVLLINTTAATATALVVTRTIAISLGGIEEPRLLWFTKMLSLAVIVGTNLVGLIFTGMEHSVQVLLSAAAVMGLYLEARYGHVAWWLAPVLVIGPLIRYENLAISLPAIAYLIVRGHRGSAVSCLAAVTVLLGGFSWYLVHIGLPPLPASVLAKSDVVSSGGSLGLLVNAFYKSVSTSPRGLMLALAVIPFMAVAVGGRRHLIAERWFAATLAVSILLHLFAGQYGWFSRYEIYLWIAVVIGLLLLFGRAIAHAAVSARPSALVSVVACAVLLGCAPYVYVLAITPLAANNIYEQNLQLRRFATEFVRQPVAVNDIGFVSWRNDHDILDLLGLASLEVQAARRVSDDETWVMPLMRRRGVRVAIVHDQPWMLERLPDEWQLAGTMTLSRRPVNVGGVTVSFFGVDRDMRDRLRAWLVEFRTQVPTGVRVDVARP